MARKLGESAGRSKNNPTRSEARRRMTSQERAKRTRLRDDPQAVVWDPPTWDAVHPIELEDQSRPEDAEVKRTLGYCGLFMGGLLIGHDHPVAQITGIVMTVLAALSIRWGRR